MLRVSYRAGLKARNTADWLPTASDITKTRR